MNGSNINLSFNLETIYKDANFILNDYDKVGVVGVNGAGKTTLFKVILNEVPLDNGKITISKDKRIGYLPQEVKLENIDTTVFEYLLQARPILELEQKLIKLYNKVSQAVEKEQTKILKQISRTQELLEYYDCYNAENIVLEIIKNMNIDDNLLDMKLKDLSGGQKSKIAFAHLLYSNPEIMLLDEPTNHLDVETRKYITEYLKQYKGMILIISHDIEFLNSIADKILFIDKQEKNIKTYKGDYDTYITKKKIEHDIKEKLINKQEKEIKKLRDIVLLYSNSSGKRKRMAQSREKTLDKKMQQLTTRDKKTKNVKLQIQPNREGSKIPLKVNNVSFSYPEKNIINNLSFNIQNNERFLIVGENGVGKSTILKLIMGIIRPSEGTIWFGNKTDIAYYAQEQENLDLNKTIIQNVETENYTEKELRTVLGNFLFHGDDVYKKVKILSPGEKARIALCKIILMKANLLILDEPTNHLDPETQKIIGQNFKNYKGTIIIVSHNPEFVETININRMLVMPKGKIINYSKEQLEHYYMINTKHY